jgi:subtilisin family serine protease
MPKVSLDYMIWPARGCIALLGSLMLMLASPLNAADKIQVRTLDDLPRHTYDIAGDPVELVKNKAAMRELAAKVKADCEADLRDYDIQDAAMLAGYQQSLQRIDIINGDYDAALSRCQTLRDLQKQPEDRLMVGMPLQAHVAALRAATGADGKLDAVKYEAAFKAELTRLIKPLPMDVIHDRLVQGRATSKLLSQNMLEEQLSPLVSAIRSNEGHVPGDVANSLIQSRFMLDYAFTATRLAGEVYGDFLDEKIAGVEQPPAKPDIWSPTLVNLDATAHAKPVVVAVWDTGIDASVFPGRIWTNPRESYGNLDHDHNGFPGDVHGIAFTQDHQPTTGELYPLDDLKQDKESALRFLAAELDLSAGVSSPDVDALQQHVQSLRGSQITDFKHDIAIISSYAHGTHVAGIIAAGNPFVRLMSIRETFDYKDIPDKAPDPDDYERWGEAAMAAIKYARLANVRVVNMSWRMPRDALEQELAIKGIGNSPAERAELSRHMFRAFAHQLHDAMAKSPDILFIAAAGNEANDADFNEYAPAAMHLRNLLTVGAVDEAGKPASFTTTGKYIDVYANGCQIDSVIPGGKHMKFSGTSMAAPQVANLAAKLIALKPDLTVQQTIDLMWRGATPMPGHDGDRIINPAASIALLRK